MASSKKLRAKGAGTIQFRSGHHWVRVSLVDGSRPWFRLCAEECHCRTLSEAKLADRAEAVSERARGKAKEEVAATERASRRKRLTVRQFGEQWTSGALYEKHGDVNGLKVKATAKDDEHRLTRYLYPVIGDVPVANVTEQDIETVMRLADAKARKTLGRAWRKGSRFQLYQALRRLFDLAIMPGRLRTDSPVSRYLRPGKDTPKLFGYLYPSEFIKLLGCTDVPVARRVTYALAVYTGLRKGSLYALKWSGVDFHHRTLTSLQSKTGLPQMFEIPESLVELLRKWHAHRGEPEASEYIVPRISEHEREGAILRADLVTAGVDRPTLIGEGESNVQPLRFHDLRATFVTWAIRDGRGDGWISDRTGHLTAEMRNRYARAARTLADLDYEPFPDVSDAIPELREEPSNVVRLAPRR